ncbi:MAG TPA: hypothetical protein VNK04_08320, partial [Gemmataceae bacterium]|nr:hypothetical protein [Gemmataceae bacterium]
MMVATVRSVRAAVALLLGLLVHPPALQGAEEPVPAAPLRTLRVGEPSGPSRVPDPWQQGVFPHPQSVTALDLTNDGRRVGVTTLAFRHDRNFWLLDDSGKIVESRYVLPWAPFQVAVLPGARAFGVGLAYSRVTNPNPCLSLFEAGKADETAFLEDSYWDSGWLRYGGGDWRTGWPVSLVGDLLVRANGSAFTIRAHDGAWRLRHDGSRERYPASEQRPLRMAASGDGRRIALGYLVPDGNGLDARTRRWLHPGPLLAVRDAGAKAPAWTAAPWAGAARVAQPPEPADEFPAMAEDFNMKPQVLVPFRVAAAVGLNGDGSRAALTEYGGWLRVKRERGIGQWNPNHPVPFCPRQRGRLRVFGAGGEELAGADLPADGLFEVRLDRPGDT